MSEDFLQRKVHQSTLALAREVLVKRQSKERFECPSEPLEQAWLLREFLKGPGKVMPQCEKTRQVDPEDIRSPVIVCAPDNTDWPCWNCMIQVLIGKKKWI